MAKRVLLGAAAVLLVIAAAYAAFFVAPEERTMGVLQRIFLFSCKLRVGRADCVFRRFCGQSSVRVEAPRKI